MPQSSDKINVTNIKKATTTQIRGFVSIDQEMGREIAMMFFNPSKRASISESGCLAGKL